MRLVENGFTGDIKRFKACEMFANADINCISFAFTMFYVTFTQNERK